MPADRFQLRLSRELDRLADQNRIRRRRQVESVSSTVCLVDGRTCVDFSSNDYLALAHHSEVLRAAGEVTAHQVGARSSPLVGGRSVWHEQLEQALAEFEQAPAALLFPSGYAANSGTLSSLVTSRDAVFCDRENHASIVDGCRLAAGRMFVYRHDQPDRLRDAVARRRTQYEQLFIVTDSVFSMDGTLAPLDELCDLAERFGAVLVVDEAHGTGVFGRTGHGVCEHLQVTQRVAVRVATLSKAIGVHGGFVAGSTALCDWLWNTARSQFFSTALPPASCAAALVSLRILQRDAARRDRLEANCRFARERLAAEELPSISGSSGPIVPVILGSEEAAVRVSRQLLDAGFFVPAIRPPSVAPGTSRLRMSLCCDHTDQQIAAVIEAIRDAVREFRHHSAVT